TLSNPTGGAAVFGQTTASAVIFDNELSAIGTLECASITFTNPVPQTGNDYSSENALSAAGRRVVYSSYSANLAPLKTTSSRSDVFVRDLAAGTNILVSVNTTATSNGNNDSYEAVISGDG